jgi:hypothetical protein
VRTVITLCGVVRRGVGALTLVARPGGGRRKKSLRSSSETHGIGVGLMNLLRVAMCLVCALMVCRAPFLKTSMRPWEHKQESIYTSHLRVSVSQQCFRYKLSLFCRYVPDMFLDHVLLLRHRPRNFRLLSTYSKSSHQLYVHVSIRSSRNISR